MQNYIVEIRKLIPSNICKKIIKYHDYGFEDAGIVTNSEGSVKKNIRNCTTKSIHPQTFGETILHNFILSKFFSALKTYSDKHKYSKVEEISQLDILKYVSNEYEAGYRYHTDFGPKTQDRAISISVCLNNDFQGGEFMFNLDGKEIQYPQNEGDCIMFPSNFMFPHQVNKVTSGTRYALIGWAI